MKNSAVRLYTIMLVIVLSSVAAAAPGFCDPLKKVAVCPLEMNSPEDLSFLQKGLFSMLFSRLSDPGKVEVLDRETIDRALTQAQASPATQGPLNESKAKLIGASLGVDYILFGSMTQFGSSVSLDLSMVSVKGEKPTLTFSKQAPEPGAVITELDMAATEINLKTFGREPELIVPKEQLAQRPETRSGEDSRSPLTNYRTLLAANGEIVGMAAGDVDGDKKNEVVVVYKHTIDILKDNGGGNLVSVQKIEDPVHMEIVGVDAADINGNGIAEIFVSRYQPATGDVHSSILEYTGGAYKVLSKDLPWYMRAVKADDGRDMLYAQKSSRKTGPYAGKDVFKVNWENNAPVPGEILRVPDGFSILSFTLGEGMGPDSMRAMFTNKIGRLVIFNETGAVEWSGEEGYGGTRMFYTYTETDKIQRDLVTGDGFFGKGVYFQPRNLVFDVDADGKKDVVIIKNKDAADGLFGQLRRFKGGSIEILRWSEMGLAPETSPKKLPGQVTDMAVTDYDNNGKNEILITLIKNANNFSSENSKSMIVAYDM
ncbi:MAG: FG-GAP-like repeat-containing protein [Desulfobacula sp.]|nr:FG-GAP-like repeat-containing protein [Desulfobacula sp.]